MVASRCGKSAKQTLRCVTLNLKGLGCDWFGARFPALVRGLKRYRPELLFLQEVGIQLGERFYSQSEELGRALGLGFVVFTPYGNPLEMMSLEQGGIALLSAWPIVSTRNRALPSARAYPPDSRVAILAEIAGPFGLIRIVNTHLSWRPEESPIRLMQMGIILQELAKEDALGPEAKTILAGDLNAEESEPVIQLLSEHLTDTYRHCHPDDPGFTDFRSNPLSEPLNLPDRRLDYVFCSRGAEVRRSQVILNDPGTPYVSDHFGVLADLRWAKAAA